MKQQFDHKLFGLESRDLLVYESMLGAPKASSIRTVATLTNQNRGTTFEIIKKLTELGLVGTQYKNKRKYYFAQKPAALKRLAEATQASVANELDKVNNYVASLSATKARDLSEQYTQYYDGEEEIAALLRDVLETVGVDPTKTYRVISSAEVRNHLYGKFRNFTRQRIKAGIVVNVLCVGKLGSKAQLANVKLLSEDDAPSSYSIIYGHKVAHISLTDFREVRGVLIQDEGVARLQALTFDKLWGCL